MTLVGSGERMRDKNGTGKAYVGCEYKINV